MNARTFDWEKAHRLEDPQRLQWTPPDEIIERLAIAPGMAIADIGAGTGFFSLPFARAVGSSGTVWAVDLQPELLRLLGEKLCREGDPGNLRPIEGEARRTGLPSGACDLVFLANVWHELDEPASVLAEVRRILRAGGRIAIMDWRADVPPPPGPPADHRIAAGAVEAALRKDCWCAIGSGVVGPYNHLLVACVS